MRLTALDIREQQFRRVMRGFDPDEVVTFLDTVASEYEQLVSENRDLRQRLLDLEHQIAEFQNMEKALRDTLMTAERVTAETRDNAQKEAALILREAEVTAQQATSGISSEILQKRRELGELQRRKKDYLLGLRSLAQSHLEMIESAAQALDAEDWTVAQSRSHAAIRQAPPPAAPSSQEATPVSAAQQPEPTASPLPTEARRVIPSAVPRRAMASPAAPEAPAPVQASRREWAEASFEPGDLVPHVAPQGAVSAREAEYYRRGITPDDPLPALLRSGASGPVAAPGVAPANPAPEVSGAADNATRAVRPDGSQGN